MTAEPTTVVITGGSSGLGMGLARRHLAKGHTVVLMARNGARLQQACDELTAEDACRGSVHHVACDVGDAEATGVALDRIHGSFGGPARLICSAGILTHARFDETNPREVEHVMRVNFLGAVNTVHAALPHMRAASAPEIILIASIAATMGVYGYSSYCASKHALLGWAESIRYELAPQGFRVVVALPPEFDSPMVDPDRIQRSKENLAVARSIPPIGLQQAIDAVMTGIDGRSHTIVPSFAARAVLAAHRMAPGLTRWVASRKIRSVRRAAQ